MEQLLSWLPYYALGLMGITMHILTKISADVPISAYFKNSLNQRQLLISFLSFNVLIFIWYDTGIEFFGMLKGIPNGQTFMLGYFGQSVLNNLLAKFQKKIDDSNKDDKPAP